MRDGRLFRITYDSGLVKYGDRRVVGLAAARVNRGEPAYRKGWITQIEAIPRTVVEWDDVTNEFIKED